MSRILPSYREKHANHVAAEEGGGRHSCIGFPTPSAGRIRLEALSSQDTLPSCPPHGQKHYEGVAAVHSETEKGNGTSKVPFPHQPDGRLRVMMPSAQASSHQIRPPTASDNSVRRLSQTESWSRLACTRYKPSWICDLSL